MVEIFYLVEYNGYITQAYVAGLVDTHADSFKLKQNCRDKTLRWTITLNGQQRDGRNTAAGENLVRSAVISLESRCSVNYGSLFFLVGCLAD